MREDQIKRLEEIEERVVEVAIADADPANWSAAGVLLLDMSKDQRGDANWCRKTAVQSVALLSQLRRLISDCRAPSAATVNPHDDDPEARIAEAEAAAADLLERVGAGPKRRR